MELGFESSFHRFQDRFLSLLDQSTQLNSFVFTYLTTSASFPLIFPVATKCSNFLVTSLGNSGRLLLSLLISFLLLLALFRISTLFFFSVHDTVHIFSRTTFLLLKQTFLIVFSMTVIHFPIIYLWHGLNVTLQGTLSQFE